MSLRNGCSGSGDVLKSHMVAYILVFFFKKKILNGGDEGKVAGVDAKLTILIRRAHSVYRYLLNVQLPPSVSKRDAW